MKRVTVHTEHELDNEDEAQAIYDEWKRVNPDISHLLLAEYTVRVML